MSEVLSVSSCSADTALFVFLAASRELLLWLLLLCQQWLWPLLLLLLPCGIPSNSILTGQGKTPFPAHVHKTKGSKLLLVLPSLQDTMPLLLPNWPHTACLCLCN